MKNKCEFAPNLVSSNKKKNINSPLTIKTIYKST